MDKVVIGMMIQSTLPYVVTLMWAALMQTLIVVHAVVEQLILAVIPFLVRSLSYKLLMLISSHTKIS